MHKLACILLMIEGLAFIGIGFLFISKALHTNTLALIAFYGFACVASFGLGSWLVK